MPRDESASRRASPRSRPGRTARTKSVDPFRTAPTGMSKATLAHGALPDKLGSHTAAHLLTVGDPRLRWLGIVRLAVAAVGVAARVAVAVARRVAVARTVAVRVVVDVGVRAAVAAVIRDREASVVTIAVAVLVARVVAVGEAVGATARIRGRIGRVVAVLVFREDSVQG